MPSNGDIKTSVLATDHENWYILNGRAVADLPDTAQAASLTLGFTSNLPDASDALLGSSASEPVGSVVGNNEITIASDNLPTLSGTGNIYLGGSTAITYNGSGYIAGNTLKAYGGSGVFNGVDYAPLTNVYSSGNENNHFARVGAWSGGSVPFTISNNNTPLNVSPKKLVVNTFIWLE